MQNAIVKSFARLDAPARTELAYELLTRYHQGEAIKEIALQHDFHPRAVYRLLVNECLDDWRSAQAAHALQKLDKGYADLEEIAATIRDKEKCSDMLELSRQRELSRIVEKQIDGAHWQLERTLRSVYGQQAPQTPPQTITINIGIERPRTPPVTATVEAQPDSAQ